MAKEKLNRFGEKIIDTHIYFSERTFKALQKRAKANKRTMSAEVVIAVENHLANEAGAVHR